MIWFSHISHNEVDDEHVYILELKLILLLSFFLNVFIQLHRVIKLQWYHSKRKLIKIIQMLRKNSLFNKL